MALVRGTNAGFVTTAPTSNPSETALSMSGFARAFKDTSPSGDNVVTEIGWYVHNASNEANFEVAIYDHNVGDNEPEAVVGSISQTNAKGTTDGWKVVTGLNIPLSASTTYWLAVQLDNVGSSTWTRRSGSGGEMSNKGADETTLTDPWGTEDSGFSFIQAIYAKVEAVSVGFTRKIKISGTFQDKPIKTKVGGTFVDKPIKIKVGGTFQDA